MLSPTGTVGARSRGCGHAEDAVSRGRSDTGKRGFRVTTTIVETVDALTPAWLTEVLAGTAVLERGGSEVVSVAAAPLGTGQMCDSYRLRLELADGSARELIAKLPSTDPNSRAAGLGLRAYEKEVRFYQELVDGLAVRTPVVHHSDIDTTTGAFVLLMEDMAPATQGDQLVGCSVDEARAALSELVGIHAPRWGDPALHELEWLKGERGPARDMMIQMLPVLWTGFLERYDDDLTDQVRSAGAVVFARLASFYEDREPVTVVHGDYRLDNLLFHPADGSVAVLDWQTCTIGPGPADAAYFVGAGLLPEVRRAHETELFDHYFRGLVGAGVDADRDGCWTAYRRGTWNGLVMAVGASMLVERTERGDQMFMAMASRHAQHAIDLDAAQLLDA